MHGTSCAGEGATHDCSQEQGSTEHDSSSTSPILRDRRPPGSHEQCGASAARGDPPPPQPVDISPELDLGQGRAERGIGVNMSAKPNAECFAAQNLGRAELDFDVPNAEKYVSKCSEPITRMRQELKQAVDLLKPMKHSKVTLFEVMCSQESELTRQCHQLGMQARRFGKEQGDLSTPTARKNMFVKLVLEQPEHVWYYPVCRPWCKWSQFNEARSLELCEQVTSDRYLANRVAWVLFEHQVSNGKHFHLEQPGGSLFLQHPKIVSMAPIARKCMFDMCMAGGLKEPLTQKHIKKAMTVITTSKQVCDVLDSHKCRGEHEHHQIAGTTKHDGKRMSLSEFSELYPRKFARQIARTLNQKRHVHLAFVADQETDDHPTKRGRLDQKSSPCQIRLRSPTVSSQDIMSEADRIAARVGPRVIEEGKLLNAVQRLCPNHKIGHLVLCRGTDRMMGPTKRMRPGEYPLRRMVCIRRRYETIEIEDQWEPWERRSYLKLRRKCAPARVNMTIFARSAGGPFEETPQEDLQHSTGKRTSQWETDRQEEARKRLKETHEPNAETDREAIDLTSVKHGPKFMALKPETKGWLLKLHKNLGHPGSAKLQAFCKHMQCAPDIIDAIEHIKCSTCMELKDP